MTRMSVTDDDLFPILRDRYPELFPARLFAKLGVCLGGWI